MELRRRHVFRATGLYVGVAWIVLQGADILLPVFEAPGWVFRMLVIVALAGAPLTAVLAWIYEYTERGIKRQEMVEAEHLPRVQSRQMDFVVIGVLVVALSFSIYLNVQEEPAPLTTLDPVSILIADFDNQTGDPVFAGSLEMALTVGLEGAPFITAYNRNSAVSLAEKLKDGAESLDIEASRLVSVQENINYVLAGTMQPNGAAYSLSVIMVDPAGGETIAEAAAFAQNKSEVLGAVGSLAGQIRAILGDTSIDSGELPLSQTLTAASLEAISDFTNAQTLVYNGRFDEALEFYQRAIDADPNLGRAFSGYALALSYMGRSKEADAMWQKAMFSLDTMTEREKYRTLGVYYLEVSRNRKRAKDNYERLAELYPADSAAQHVLAILYFFEQDFQRAQEKGLRIVEIYPNSLRFRRNLALYAMYAGDFETAVTEAQQLLEQDPSYYRAYLPLAMAALVTGDAESAIGHYRKMAETDASGASLAAHGLADMAIYAGKFEEAKTLLTAGMVRDREAGETRNIYLNIASLGKEELAHKAIALASIQTMAGSSDQAEEAIREGLEHSRTVAIVFPAAQLLIELGRSQDAAYIADELGSDLQPHRRAYGKLIEGILAMDEGDAVAATRLVKQSIDLTDLWLAHLHLGIIYLEAGHAAEALSEFELCEARITEATSLFLDDFPTWRYGAGLLYWKARAHEAIDMRTPAVKSYKSFLALRPEPSNDPLAADARRRVMALGAE